VDKNQSRLSVKVCIDAGFGMYYAAEILKIIVDVYAVGKWAGFYKCLFIDSQ
jgi:hypothetical protein